MKNLVFAILIAFIPALFTGCEKDGNIVDKFTPEPTLEAKYGAETIAMLESQTTFSKKEVSKYLKYAKEVSDKAGKISFVEERDFQEKMPAREYRRLRQKTLPSVEKMFFYAASALERYEGNLDGALDEFLERYYLPPHPEAEEGIEELVKRTLVAVIFGYTFDDFESAIITEGAFMTETTKGHYSVYK